MTRSRSGSESEKDDVRSPTPDNIEASKKLGEDERSKPSEVQGSEMRKSRSRSRSKSVDEVRSPPSSDEDVRSKKKTDDRAKDSSEKRRARKKDEQKKAEEKAEEEKKEKKEPLDLLRTRTGGAYIPPAKLRMLQDQIQDKVILFKIYENF
ncbi:unnamed protein product [Strongylus vulgaris]|uniref:Uncharacterized protein n=1 Tax=Strongylus vulgaris TaxID=40348 RepID=A0A3P7LXK8_STRVU|nr:unnamed protein product [Strongylus vulgaris]